MDLGTTIPCVNNSELALTATFQVSCSYRRGYSVWGGWVRRDGQIYDVHYGTETRPVMARRGHEDGEMGETGSGRPLEEGDMDERTNAFTRPGGHTCCWDT